MRYLKNFTLFEIARFFDCEVEKNWRNFCTYLLQLFLIYPKEMTCILGAGKVKKVITG